MARFVYAVPGPLSAPPAVARPRLRMSWTGPSGKPWDLTDPRGGVFLAADGLIGLGAPPAQRFVSTSPAVAGSRWRGMQTLERPVKWRVWVYVENGSWLDTARAFLDDLSRQVTGVWTVTFPTQEKRSLLCRFVDDGQHAYDVDPLWSGWALYEIELVAEDPYWLGEPVIDGWDTLAPEDFFGGSAGVAPDFVISSGRTLAAATIANPGDVDAWPVWTVTGGALTAVQVGLGGHLLGATLSLPTAADDLVIDTDPRRQSSVVNGVRVRGLLSPHDFAPIPAGAEVPLSLSITGQGRVSLSFVPRYERCI